MGKVYVNFTIRGQGNYLGYVLHKNLTLKAI